MQLAGIEVEGTSEPGFVPSPHEDLPPRFQEEAGSPAWRRALEISAAQRQGDRNPRMN